MLILKTKNPGLWVRHMRCLSLPVDENGNARSGGQYLLIPARCLSRFKGVQQKAASQEEEDITSRSPSPWSHGETALPTTAPPKSVFGGFYNNGNSQDLRRFLEEVGTDPKEARFWLKTFKRSSESVQPFAVVQVDGSIFREPETLDKLASTLAFLHRNNMKCVVVHGESLKAKKSLTQEQLKKLMAQTSQQSMLLASILELHGAPARPLFAGSNIIQATPVSTSDLVGNIVGLNPDPVYWAIQSDHIPIIQGIGESFCGQMLGLDVCNATAQLAQMLQPRKVLFITTSGGITNDKNEVIPNISLPCSEKFFEQSWCTPEVRQQIEFVSSVLYSLPQQSSVVVTAANKLLAELFTHRGSGTFFKITEPITKYDSLKGVDTHRLLTLFNKSFGRDLLDDYLSKLEDNMTALYLSEDYSAAAIVTCEPGAGVPYLDKFAVSVAKQSEGTADVLWEMLRKDFKKLCWRSRGSNPINPWYFKRCEGSWSNGQWIVFWYGGVTHRESSLIVDHALSLPSSFKT